MKLCFPSDMPIWEQLIRAAKRKQKGRKHNKVLGPGRQKNPPKRDAMRAAAWRKYQEQVTLFYAGHRETMPAKPI